MNDRVKKALSAPRAVAVAVVNALFRVQSDHGAAHGTELAKGGALAVVAYYAAVAFSVAKPTLFATTLGVLHTLYILANGPATNVLVRGSREGATIAESPFEGVEVF